MIENSAEYEYIDGSSIPDGAIVLEFEQSLNISELAIAALKKVIKDRNINLSIVSLFKFINPQGILSINRFAVQVLPLE